MSPKDMSIKYGRKSSVIIMKLQKMGLYKSIKKKMVEISTQSISREL